MSRPRKLCEVKQNELLTLLAFGCPLSVAARHVDCSIYTIRREARRNPEFDARLRGRLLEAELSPISMLHEASQSDWRAAAWLLERTQPQLYARRSANTLGQPELNQLVQRLGAIVDDEISDRRQAARLRHRLRLEIQVVFDKLQPFSNKEDAKYLARIERSAKQAPAEKHLLSTASKMEAKLEQNLAKSAAPPIRANDVSPWNSRAVLCESA